MSLPLHVHGELAAALARPLLGRVATRPVASEARRDTVLLTDRWREAVGAAGYAGAMTPAPPSSALPRASRRPAPVVVHSLRYRHHLVDGDVVAIHPNGYVRTLYRMASPHNALFVTDRCNSWCLMCSQPPRPVDDRDRIGEHLRLIELIDPGCRELGITGGEPTLLKDDLLLLIERCRDRLPRTALHILSNGRLFYYGAFARRLAAIGHPDLMIGIPLYSAREEEHDYVVQSAGAYAQTLIGIHNLGRYGVPVEIRVVIHRQTWRGLRTLAAFLYRNVPFASHVTFMGLEMMGFAVPNAGELWIDPYDYQHQLEAAVLLLHAAGMRVSIYNHQLCVVPSVLWPFCRRSISDWKNDYLPACEPCAAKDRCGGFFTSSLRRQHSAHIAPLAPAALRSDVPPSPPTGEAC